MFRGRRRRREEELARLDAFRAVRRLMDEDVTVLGEQVAELHVDTLADELDEEARHHYRRALELYEQAKLLLSSSATVAEVLAIDQVVADARWHRAAVIALVEGEPLPERREPCFFDPRHGPSMTDVAWAPPGGAERSIAVCAADARRLAAGEEPLVRLVRVGDRWVPWHKSGGMAGYVNAQRHVTSAGHGVHVQHALGAAYVEQTFNGPNAPGGGSHGF